MNEFPKMPSHYIKSTINDMFPGDIYYPHAEILRIDRITKQPHLDKYEHVSLHDLYPTQLIGRFGLMRVFEERDSGILDGYIIDIRPVDFGMITLEQDDFTPGPDDSYDTIEAMNEDRKDYISPLAIIAYGSQAAEENVLLLGDPSLESHMVHLINHSNDLMNQANLRAGRIEDKRISMMANRRKNVRSASEINAEKTD